jgi:epoxyqueuosine reductase QueG
MKKLLTDEIKKFVKARQEQDDVHTEWGEPLVGFADVWSPYIQKLQEIVGPDHGLPQDILPDASIVLVYYVPFTRELAKTNRTGTHLASPDWARAYEETNAMFRDMNEHLIDFMGKKGVNAKVAPQAATFDQQKLISSWSFRHFAFAAGLGTFGMNNMLITKHGCCGRYNTIVTDLDVEPDQPVENEEYCLYKKNGTCGVCFKNCPVGALTPEGYDRHLCYTVLRENAEVYTDFGSSYLDESGENANSVGSEVCGKCVTQSPCAFWNLDK